MGNKRVNRQQAEANTVVVDTDDSQAEIDAVLAMINGDEAPVSEPDGGSAFVENDASDDAVVEPETIDTIADDATMTDDGENATATDIEEVEPEPEDINAAIAELEAEEQDTTPAPAAKKRSAKKTDTTAAPAAPKRNFTDVAGIDETTLKAVLDGCSAKKVTEKIVNWIQAIETGKKLSRYTGDMVRKLAADGRISSKSLVEEFLAKGLSDGTARAQAQQMTMTLKMLGVAMPDATNARELVLVDERKLLIDETLKLAA